MEKYQAIQTFMNEEGLLIQWPSKKRKKEQRLVLDFLAENFNETQQYSEKEINELLNKLHTFNDSAMLRRAMIGSKILDRTNDCRAYWLNKECIQQKQIK